MRDWRDVRVRRGFPMVDRLAQRLAHQFEAQMRVLQLLEDPLQPLALAGQRGKGRLELAQPIVHNEV